ncbi:MAG: endonuclease/exonuclease/phosphatase family protein [Acidobacteriota bacterium]|nr:endonuclease/exonuclease/phosphatase family protein [Acidobacteriota bacterium]MDH3786647.1 endonuclease/exonuclease/phosphatase family protein [Acidobacteriota bacterium]
MRLRVLTYNIHRAIGMDRRFRPERIVRIVAHHDPDVVLLQEVDCGVPRSREMDMARELAVSLRFPHYVVGHNHVLRKGRYGNATLSRHPIEHERNIDLTVGAKKKRGCQHTRIRMDGDDGIPRHVDVFNLHLGLSARERTHQLGLLAESGEFAAVGHDGACLVGGDFNDWRSLLHPVLTGKMAMASATSRADAPSRAVATYPSFSPTGGLDRIYFRGPLKSVSVTRCPLPISRIASDHLPILADFHLD